jgi:hypothetical protein
VSGLTPEEIKAVWPVTKDEEGSYIRFDLEAFQKVNEKRQAEGKPTVGLGEAADAAIEAIDIISALVTVLRAAVVTEIAKCKTGGEINKCYDPMPTSYTEAAKRKRRSEIRAERKAARAA